MAQGELQRRRGKRDAVAGAGVAHPARPGQQAARGRGVVVGRVVAGVGQDAAVEHAARQHGDPAPLDEPGQRGGRIHAGADGADRALSPEFGQRGYASSTACSM